MDKRKSWFIAVSIVFLGLFLSRDFVKNICNPTVMSVKVVSPEEMAIQKAKNKDEWREERITLLEERVEDLHIKMNDLLDYLKSKGE